jgi:hypothetical protein
VAGKKADLTDCCFGDEHVSLARPDFSLSRDDVYGDLVCH